MTPDKPSSSTRIAVALSGGVDSAVSAALMKHMGADVVALTMRLQKQDDPTDAVRVAESLGIPVQVIDLTQKFESEVIADFVETYVNGATPVPCARCNRLIKFGALMDISKELGAQALVTGHYVRRVETMCGSELHVAADPKKDQSYFLFDLTKDQIDYARFPLGDFRKDETRRLAEQFRLPVAQKKESQDICFVPCGDYADIVQKMRPEAVRSGEIVDQSGHVLGQHSGISHFTVGQRKGLNLSDRVGDNNEPLFVLSLDVKTARVVVGPRQALAKTHVFLDGVNWQGRADFDADTPVRVRLRSSQNPVEARFNLAEGVITLLEPVFGVAKGQAGVIYQETRLLGGGRIARAE